LDYWEDDQREKENKREKELKDKELKIHREEQTVRWRDRQTDGQTDKKLTKRQTHKEIESWLDGGETERKRD